MAVLDVRGLHQYFEQGTVNENHALKDHHFRNPGARGAVVGAFANDHCGCRDLPAHYCGGLGYGRGSELLALLLRTHVDNFLITAVVEKETLPSKSTTQQSATGQV